MTIGSTGAIALLCSLTLAAQAPADRAAIEKTLMENEQKVNAAFSKTDVATMKMYIASDAALTQDSGYGPVASFFTQMPTMNIKVTEEKLSDFKFLWADPTTVILSFKWTGKGTVMGQPMPSQTYAATVWTKRGDKWLAVYHQETSAAPMAGMAGMPGMAPAKK
jgi:ketosteroid isomerase-like protein